MDKNWYIVQTYSSYENKAKKSLEERIEREGFEDYFDEVFIPTEQVTEIRNGKKIQVTRKVFNGYVFVRMALNDQTWHLVNDTPKVVGFLGNRRDPPPVPEEQVRRITEKIEEGSAAATTTYNFQQGARVRVIDGNFLDFTGTIEEVNEEKEKLRVLVEIFGRPTPVELDFDQVTNAEE